LFKSIWAGIFLTCKQDILLFMAIVDPQWSGLSLSFEDAFSYRQMLHKVPFSGISFPLLYLNDCNSLFKI
jgi:hypothetical protein